MKLKEYIQQEVKRQLTESKLLTEAFKSDAVRKFIKLVKPQNAKRLPYEIDDIRWSEIEESDVKLISASEATPFIKEGYVIFWYLTKKQVLKYKPVTYSKTSGTRYDNNEYVHEGIVAITYGKEFLYGNSTNLKIASERYDKPYDGKISLLKLRTGEFADTCLVISSETLQKYSSIPLKGDRQKRKSGALALIPLATSLARNKNRYNAIKKANANNKTLQPIQKKVEEKLNSIKNEIDTILKANILTFVGKNPDDRYSYDRYNIDMSGMQKVEKLVSKYNSLSRHFTEYVKELKLGYEHSIARQLKYLEDDLAS